MTAPVAAEGGSVRPLSWKHPGDWLALVLIGLVRVYQWTLSPLVGRQCRFEPTCSHYFIGAVRKNGAIVGACRGVWRICRCHPFHPGGYDPP
ncbi:MAG: membrane protein insertion efficiency factor YidD [Planctomyces sp.]|nr:membrane protein insertion efficiency factor YidD [Planctomyces sp.]